MNHAGPDARASACARRLARQLTFAMAVATMTAGAWSASGADAKALAPEGEAVTPAPSDALATSALLAYREAVAKLTAFSYTAHSSVSGAATTDDPDAGAGVVTASVHALRAEAGGWKLYTRGDVRVGDEVTTSFEIATDSVTARSLRVKDRVVAERTIESLEDTRVFFTGQSGRHPIAWELLEAIGEGEVASASHEGSSDVEGHACEVVRVELRPKRETVGGANPAQGGAPKSVQVVRLHLSKADHLPRRIERFLMVTGAPEAAVRPQPVRTLDLKDLKVGEESIGASYTLEVPDGYRVRAADTRKSLGAKGPDRAKGRDANAGGGANKPRELAGNNAAISWPTDPELLAPGKIAPRFRLADMEGKRWSNKDYAGKVVVMDFWATWCQPCRIAMPALQRLHEKYKDKPVAIVGLNIEEDHDLVRKFKADGGYTYQVLLDATAILDSFKVGSYPTFYVISPSGKVLWGASGIANPPGLDGRQKPEVYQKYIEDTLSALIDAELAAMEAGERK